MTRITPVTRDIFVNMFAKKTIWAMVGVTRTIDFCSANFTNEILVFTDKIFSHPHSYEFYQIFLEYTHLTRICSYFKVFVFRSASWRRESSSAYIPKLHLRMQISKA